MTYYERYIKVTDFIKYCDSLNVKTDQRELEHYEKTGLMLPLVRVLYPDDYVRFNALRMGSAIDKYPEPYPWAEFDRLSDKRRVFPEEYADLDDSELIDSLDREMGQNSHLIRPTIETYKPWDSYNLSVPYNKEGEKISQSTSDHYYSPWQVHHLYYLQQYPDLYKNKILLDQIPDDVKKRMRLPRAFNRDFLASFKGLGRMFDALSFWSTMYHREHSRTFALIPAEHQVKYLNESQHEAYLNRLISDAKMVQQRYGITTDSLYEFLYQLTELYTDYQKVERYKLAEEVRNEIIYLSGLIEMLTDSEWDAIAEELGHRYPWWTKKTFRHLDISVKERDEAYDLFEGHLKSYRDLLIKLGISTSTRIFSTTEINEILDYCEREGFSFLITALSGMIATKEEIEKKFRRVSLYTNLKSVLMALEIILKSFVVKRGMTADTLTPAIECLMRNEIWYDPLFLNRHDSQRIKSIPSGKKLTNAKTSQEFLEKIELLLQDPDLIQSEDAYWARVFLMTILVRNFTAHLYSKDDAFYADAFPEMLRAATYAILYSWQVAKREGWVVVPS